MNDIITLISYYKITHKARLLSLGYIVEILVLAMLSVKDETLAKKKPHVTFEFITMRSSHRSTLYGFEVSLYQYLNYRSANLEDMINGMMENLPYHLLCMVH